ncbi:sugar ABC transporter ATP-binding protein [Rhizobium leguminosarum]|uniref:sugar ABC transporter ATP-binding protein n=1 Tax=Rhizobium leguminosarum TaxID=384 RepID=UPI00143F802D|nr:sugar ABC transporter ATP-binding protein [Rhizobium leguminosarum]NKL21224.1 ATP-binding cassette domain-containing protein [Rhizobium leguminosarum bv. viciae]NKL56731.1 ATP-binding cassette domain-containing protein [Rhizobium leguminosarum bv. viciae]
MPQQVTVRLTEVAKSFGETRALKKCDFEACSGEVHAIVGENGSGKSTMAKIMSGVLNADAGEALILNERIRTPLDAKRVGLATIFQEVLVADEASILDNLYVGCDSFFGIRTSTEERGREAQVLLDRLVGHPMDLKATVGDLPLSVKQWIVIARAILRRPKVLILDESSAALDLDATLRLHDEIDRLRAAGSTVIIVTHRIAELVRIADRATVLRDGVTVGRLQKHEITEANLLAMMTPADRRLSEAANASGRASAGEGRVVLKVSEMTAQRGGAPFDFTLEEGSIVGVAGLDGQGQDAFLRAVARIVAPFGGDVHIRSEGGDEMVAVRSLLDAARLGIVYVSGDRKREGIFPQQSIFENLAIGIYRRNLGPCGVIKKGELKRIFAREVDRFRVKMGSSQNRITSLSGGNQQKILIGRAFANDPRVIVLNDPARGVDLGTKRDLYRELRAFADRGGAVIYLSSEIEEFLGFADRVDVFHGGSVFRSLHADDIEEEAILAAMFGQSKAEIVEFTAERKVH